VQLCIQVLHGVLSMVLICPVCCTIPLQLYSSLQHQCLCMTLFSGGVGALQVVQQCVGTEGVEPEYIKTEVLPEFFRCFWQRRMALDRRNYRALVETTVALANKVRTRVEEEFLRPAHAHVCGRWRCAVVAQIALVIMLACVGCMCLSSCTSSVACFRCYTNGPGALAMSDICALCCTTFRLPCVVLQVGVSEIVSRVVEDLKDEAEPYRRMVMETIDKVVTALGAADIDARLEELLVDGILYAFQEQVRPRDGCLNMFATAAWVVLVAVLDAVTCAWRNCWSTASCTPSRSRCGDGGVKRSSTLAEQLVEAPHPCMQAVYACMIGLVSRGCSWLGEG
jgi:hypothetical protein